MNKTIAGEILAESLDYNGIFNNAERLKVGVEYAGTHCGDGIKYVMEDKSKLLFRSGKRVEEVE